MTEFVPYESFRRLFAHWWIVLALTVLGGIGGWSIHLSHPPIYEAQAELTATIDPTISISQYDEDLAIGTVNNLIRSGTVIARIVSHAQSLGVTIDASIIPQTFTPERQHASWVLRVRHSDPETAAVLSNLWAEQAYAVLISAHQNILQVSVLGSELNSLQACLANQVQTTPADSPVVCGSVSIENYQEVQQSLLSQLDEAQQQTGGLSPYLLFGLGTPAAVPDQPVAYGIAMPSFAGALIGFLLGAGFLMLWK